MTSHVLYIALGLQPPDPGFGPVADLIHTLGDSTVLGQSLWHLVTECDADAVFKQLNTSMMDRRIDSTAGLIVVDPAGSNACWHLRQPLNDLLQAQWGFANNLFIAFDLKQPDTNQQAFLQRLTRIGTWAAISKTTWYVSASTSTRDALYYLSEALLEGDRLCIFDSTGNHARWESGKAPTRSKPAVPATSLPHPQDRSE